MELLRCPNCQACYGDVQDECPGCGADHDGDGARLVFDATTRKALVHLGGLYGGILEQEGERFLLWCELGVCLYSEYDGCMWHAKTKNRVDDVRVADGFVSLSTSAGSRTLDMSDGSVV